MKRSGRKGCSKIRYCRNRRTSAADLRRFPAIHNWSFSIHDRPSKIPPQKVRNLGLHDSTRLDWGARLRVSVTQRISLNQEPVRLVGLVTNCWRSQCDVQRTRIISVKSRDSAAASSLSPVPPCSCGEIILPDEPHIDQPAQPAG